MEPVEMEGDLASYLRLATKCTEEAMTEQPAPLEFLTELDRLFMSYLPHAGGIKNASAALLLMSAHATFRASVGLAFSGQLLPVFMAVRGSIESALYANAMVVEPSLSGIWLNRGRDANSKQACRDQFTVGKMMAYVAKAQDEAFSVRVRDAYDATIDFGAHPNSHSLLSSTKIDELETGQHAVNFAYLHGAKSFELRQSLVACCECGLIVFFLALVCFSDHPKLEELNKRALHLQDKLPVVIAALGFSREPSGT